MGAILDGRSSPVPRLDAMRQNLTLRSGVQLKHSLVQMSQWSLDHEKTRNGGCTSSHESREVD